MHSHKNAKMEFHEDAKLHDEKMKDPMIDNKSSKDNEEKS